MHLDMWQLHYTLGKHDEKDLIQLVVPESLREKVVSLAHDTLLSGHRGSSKTLNRVLQEFYWPGINNFVLKYVSSCDLCQRNVSKGTVGKAPLGSLPVTGTPFSVVCVDLIGPLSPQSDGNRWILTIIDMCPRFPECIPLRDISSVVWQKPCWECSVVWDYQTEFIRIEALSSRQRWCRSYTGCYQWNSPPQVLTM